MKPFVKPAVVVGVAGALAFAAATASQARVRAAYDRYAYTPGYAGYGAYAAAPAHRYRGYRSGYDPSIQSVPPHYDPGYGYNSNTISPWQEHRLEGHDY